MPESAVSSDVRADIAATLAEPAAAPLQGGGDVSGGAAQNAAPAIPGQQAQDAGLTAQPDASQQAPPVEQAPKPKDDFQIDLDREPDAPEEAKPSAPEGEGAEADQPTDPDADIGALLATPRGRKIYAEWKKARALSELPNEDGSGGIGHVPTVEQTKAYFRSFTDKQNMVADFESGHPQAAEAFWDYWFGQDSNGVRRSGSVEAATKLPEYLAQKNPEAYQAVAEPIIDRYMQAAVGRFMEARQKAASPEEAKAWYEAAQRMHFDLYGSYFDPQTVNSGAPPQAAGAQAQKQPDEVQRLRAQVQELTQGRAQEARTQFAAQVDGRVDRALVSDVDTALKPIKDLIGKGITQVAFEAQRDHLINAVKAALDKNRDAMSVYRVARQRIVQGLSEDQIGNLVRSYRQLAFPVIQARYKDYISAAGQQAVQDNAAQRAQLQRSAQKVAPAGAGAPVQQSIAPALLEKQTGESQADWIKRDMRSRQG
jgi:hypothetical protein